MAAISADLARRIRAQSGADAPPAELLARYAAARDPEAFAGLVRQFGPLVLGVCRRTLGSAADADDAFQAVFLALARQARTFRDAQTLPAWLHRVALRTARKARARRRLDPAASAAPAGGGPARGADPFAEVAWKDVRRVLDEELDALPEECRGPVVLCWLDGLTRDEAAARLGLSPTTLKRRLGAGRELLRGRLTRRGLAPLLVAAAAGPDGLRAAVPPALARAATEAARGVGGSAALLSRTLPLATVAVALACGVALVAADRTRTEPAPAPRPAAPADGPAAGAAPPGAVVRFGSTHFRVEDEIRASALSPDGKRIAVACDAEVRVYDAATWRLIRTLPAGGDGVLGVYPFGHTLAFSPDGRRLAFTRNWQRAFVWDLKTGKLTQRFDRDARKGWAPFCAFTPEGHLALSDDEGLRFFDPDTGAEKRAVGAANVLALSPDGKRYVRCTEMRTPATLVLGDAVTGTDTHTFATTAAWWPGVSFTPDGKRVSLVPTGGVEVELWDAEKPALVRRFRSTAPKHPEDHSGYCGGLTPDGREVWIRLPNGDLARWDAHTSRELPRLKRGTGPAASGYFALPDGRTLLAPSGWGWVRVFDRESGAERTIPGRYGDSTAFALSPDGEFVAAGDPSGRIDLLDPATGKRVRTLRETGGAVEELAFGPDGAVLGVCESGSGNAPGKRHESVVRAVWVADGKEVWSRAGAGEADKEADVEALNVLGFTAEDRALVSHYPKDVRAWDTRTGKEVYRIGTRNLRGTVGPGGNRLASEDHGDVVLFDLATGRETKRLEVDPAEKANRRRTDHARFAWAADGRTLVTTLPADWVCVVDPVAGKERTRFRAYEGEPEARYTNVIWRDGNHSVFALALAPDGKRLLASALGARYVALWDTRTGKQLARLEPGFGVTGAAFGPDGTSVYTFGSTGLGYRWDVEKLIAAQKK